MSDKPIHLWPDWRIDHVIGSGSNGKVYEIHRQNGAFLEKAALKVIRVPQDRSELEQLRMDGLRPENTETYFAKQVEEIRNEIGVMKSLEGNSNIVSYEDYRIDRREGEVGWDILIRMELLTALPDYLVSHPMSEEDVIRLGMDISEALKLCHAEGIIHRDIKPQNIFVNKWGTFKLGDFGIARKMPGNGSVMSFKGTVSYMAPETFRMVDTDVRSDIYSLALVLYRILNGGREPFLSTNSYTPQEKEEAQRKRLSGERIPPPEQGSKVLWRILSVALLEDPSSRYQTVEEFHDALETIGTGKDEITHGIDEADTFYIDNKHKDVKKSLYRKEEGEDITKTLFLEGVRTNLDGKNDSLNRLKDGHFQNGIPMGGASPKHRTDSRYRNNNNHLGRNNRNGNSGNRRYGEGGRFEDRKKRLPVWPAVLVAIILLVTGTVIVTYRFLESRTESGQDGNSDSMQNSGSGDSSESGDNSKPGDNSESGSNPEEYDLQDESQQAPYVSYSYSCVDTDGNVIAHSAQNYSGKMKAGGSITFIAPEIDGYTIVGEKERKIILSEIEDENVQVFTYSRNPTPLVYNTEGRVRILNRKSDKKREFEYLAKRFEKESGIKVTVDTPGAGGYSTALKEQLTGSGEDPTLFMLSGIMDYKKYGYECFDLTNSEIAAEICDEKYTLKGEDGKIYGLACIIESYGITVNTRLLANAGYEITDIRSFTDLKEIVEDITNRKKELGFAAFTTPTISRRSTGYYRLSQHAAVVPLFYEFSQNGFQTNRELKGIYTDGLRNYVDLCLEHAACSIDEAITFSLEDSRQEFREGKAVFHQDGSWGYETLHDALGEDMAVIPMYMGIAGEENQALNETCSYYWCVNKNASFDDVEATLQFLNWLVTSDEGTEIVEKDMDFQMPYKNARIPNNIYLQTLQEQKEDGRIPVWQYYTEGKEESWTNALTNAIEAYATGEGSWDAVKTAFTKLW